MKVPSFLTPWFLYIFSLSCFFITNYQRLPNDITNAFFAIFLLFFPLNFHEFSQKFFKIFLIFLVEFFYFLFSLLFFYKFSLAHAIALLFPLLLHKYNAFLFCLSWLVFICSNFVQIPYLFSLLDFLFCYFFAIVWQNFSRFLSFFYLFLDFFIFLWDFSQILFFLYL